MARLDLTAAMANVRTLVQDLSAWQTICGVDNATDAGLRIFEGGTDDVRPATGDECDGNDPTVAPCMLLRFDPLATEWMASTSHGTLIIELRTELAMPKTLETYSAKYLWVWQHLANLLAGINDNVGDSGQLMVESIGVPLEPAPLDPDDNNGRDDWNFHIAIGVHLL